jgi:hypothetical protein
MFRDGFQRRPNVFIGTPPVLIVLSSQESEMLPPAHVTVARPAGIRVVLPSEAGVNLPPNTTIANPTSVAVLRETDP